MEIGSLRETKTYSKSSANVMNWNDIYGVLTNHHITFGNNSSVNQIIYLKISGNNERGPKNYSCSSK